MANFLDNLSSYNAKAALAISNAVACGDTQKANMMSSLKSTANDTTLSEAVRLNALTALVNLGNLLDVPLPPYFPMSIQYADIQTYDGIHNDLLGLQGGAPNEYFHLTSAERASIAGKATLSDITWGNLLGSYSDNVTFAALFDAKQTALSAPAAGDYFVKINGTTISYDNSVYLTSSTGVASGSAAGGDLGGTYPNPTVLNSAVISKVLTGWNGSATNTPVTASDSILSGMQKLNARITDIVNNPGGVSSVALSTNAPGIFDGTAAQTGAATVTLGLRSQSQNLFLASSSTTNNTQPTFRAIDVADLPTASGVTPAQYGTTSLIPQITVDAKGRITAISTVSAAAGGQVNSVTFNVPAGTIYSVSTAGTAADPVINFSIQAQAPNTVYAGPSTGSSSVVPSFRTLVAADIANIAIPQSQVTDLVYTLSTFLTGSLANSTIYIGNGSDAAVNAKATGAVSLAYVDNNGANEAQFTLNSKVVTYDKIEDVTAQTILGRYSLTNGTIQSITLDASDFTLNNSTGVLGLVTPNPPTLTTKGDLITSNGTSQVRLGVGADATLFMADTAATTGNKWVAMSGDATIATTGAVTIANGAVTLGKMANLAANRIIGNNTGSAAAPIALTTAQATAMLDLFSTSSTTKGLVQGSNGADNTHFLRADNTWQPITGTGTVTTVSVVSANGFAGTVATSTTTPAITLTTTITGLLKGNGTAISAAAAGVGGDYVAPGSVTSSGLTMATSRLLGRTTSSVGPIEEITIGGSLSLASTTLGINLANTNIFTAQQEMTAIKLNGATSGYVSFTPPASAGTQAYVLPAAYPTGGGTKFLTSNGSGTLTWDTPAGSGTTTNAVTFNSGGSGDSSGATFNGSTARTISYNTIGAQALNANLTGLSALTYASGAPLVKMTAAGTFTLDNSAYVTGTATQYAVLIGGAGNTVASLSAGTVTGQILRYVSGSNNPAWSTATYPGTTSINKILYSSANNVVGEIDAPSDATFLRYTTAGGYSWNSAVTSLGFGTQGLISNSGTATAPVLAVSGNSGGVVYFSNTTTWASSGTLDQYELMMGGGAGSPPTTINNSSSVGAILTSNGTSSAPSWTTATYPSTTSINRILFSSANNVVDQITAPSTANKFLKWDGSTFTWADAGGGGGGGTVEQVSVVTDNGFSGVVANATTTPAITLSTTITGILKGSGGDLVAAAPGTDYLTSVGLTMPSAFTVTNSPLTANGTFTVTGAGTVAQYIRGDGSLANFPTSGGGGGSVNYYLNGSVTPSPDVVGYKQMSRVANTGAAANFTRTNTVSFQLMAEFVTDANDPGLLSIPAGSWNFSFYFSSSNNSDTPQFYVELLKYDGTTFTSIATGIASPETITNGTTIDLYNTSITIPSSTALTLTDRLVIRVYVDTDGNRTVTFYTQATRLAEVFTTFTTGITALNGLTAQVQSFANGSSGTAPAFVSSTATHTLNIPLASTASVTAGLISNTDYTTFSNKITNPMTASGDIIYGGALGVPTPLPIGTTNQVLAVSAGGLPTWTSAGGGDVTGPAGATDGDFVVFNGTTGKIIAEPTTASFNNSTGRATFNGGVDLGVISSATGTLVFRNSANAFTTTIQASASASASASYSWPQAPAASAGLILANDGSGNLSWTAAGAGNMILASTQTNTGAKTFNSGTLILAGSTSGTTILNAAATAGSTTVTLPALTGTVALLENAQTFTGAKTFGTGAFAVTSAATFSASASAAASVTINPAANWSLTNPQLLISSNASGIQWMSFGVGDRNTPAFTTRSSGTKIVLYATVTAGNADHAIGVANSVTWISAPTATGHRTSIYGGTSELASFRNSGIYAELAGSSTQGQVTIGTNTASTYAYLDFGGGTNVRGVPAATRSVGTRINMFAGSGGTDDHSIGVAANETWIKTNNAVGGTISFYGGITKLVDITATAGSAPVINLNAATGEYRVNGVKVVQQRGPTYGAPTATLLRNALTNSSTTTDVLQTLAALITDLRTHGLIG